MDVGNISTPFLMDGFCLKNHVSGYLLYHLGRLRGLHGGYIFLPRQTLAPVWSYLFLAPVTPTLSVLNQF